jgi:hypothetical protein
VMTMICPTMIVTNAQNAVEHAPSASTPSAQRFGVLPQLRTVQSCTSTPTRDESFYCACQIGLTVSYSAAVAHSALTHPTLTRDQSFHYACQIGSTVSYSTAVVHSALTHPNPENS